MHHHHCLALPGMEAGYYEGLVSPRNLAFKELSQCGDTAKPCASKDSGNRPWSSFLEPGALHISTHTNQRHQLPIQMQPSEGTGLNL